MIVKFKRTGNESAVEFELFKENFSHQVDQFEFIDGTKAEKKWFESQLKKLEQNITEDEQVFLSVS